MIHGRAEWAQRRGWRSRPFRTIRVRAEWKLQRVHFVANATRDWSVPLPSRQFIVSRLSAQAP